MDASPREGRGSAALFAAAVLAVFALLAVSVYRDALDGPFVSDDAILITGNPYVQAPERGWLVALFDPDGRPRHYAGGNYAPLLHIGHALEWRVFGSATRGYHLVNVALHAANAALLVLLLHGAGIGRRGAALLGALFLLHPANVEAVAWISQLRTLLAMAFALLALLLFQRAPRASAALFALALLAKAAAVFALPMAAAAWWSGRRGGGTPGAAGRGLLLWLLVLAVYAPIQLGVFTVLAVDARGEPYADVATGVRTTAAIGARYLAMASTGYGTAFFQGPEPVEANLDPWWLAGLVAAVLFSWRIAATLRAGRPEAGWWLGTAAGFAPVSQVIPFFFPMADRYLYFILPGLLGGGALALGDAVRRLAPSRARALRAAALAVAGIACVGFAIQSTQRAVLWQSIRQLYGDSARRHPDAAIGHFMAAVEALERGDRAGAVASLRASMERGGHLVQSFRSPVLAGLAGDPAYEALLRDVAADRIALLRARGELDPMELAGAHYQRGELDRAIEALEEGIRRDGPRPEWIGLVQRLRAERAARERGGDRGGEGAPRAPARPEDGPPGLPPLLP